jgi:sugar O-acyltransferase (sialic acid O-acetyltransferase NeuD family)
VEQRVLVIGTGNHAKVVAEILRACGRTVAGYVAPRGQSGPQRAGEIPVLAWSEALDLRGRCECIVGIGDNLIRQELTGEAEGAGFALATAVHPAAVVGPGVGIGPGSVVAPGAILVLDVTLGRGVIVNTGACVDHDCRIGDWCHVGPGAVLAGSVVLGDGVFVGAGSVVINNITIGRYSVAGAGAVVVGDIPETVVAVGVPAAVLRDGEK